MRQLYDATKRYGEKIEAQWTLDIIKETVARFDFDGDGKMNREEFQAALDNLVMKKPPKAKGSKERRKSLQGSLKRAWTFKKLPTIESVARHAAEEAAHEQEAADEAATAALMDEVLRPAETLEQKEKAFWDAQDTQPLWKVPFGLNRDRMPWAADGTTGLSMAIARARAHGKTSLIVDPSFDKIADNFYMAAEMGAKVLKARKMFEDEQQQIRTHGEVMNETRKLLVEAMVSGLIALTLEHSTTRWTPSLVPTADARVVPSASYLDASTSLFRSARARSSTSSSRRRSLTSQVATIVGRTPCQWRSLTNVRLRSSSLSTM